MTEKLGARGARLLASLTAKDATLAEEGNPMREVALSAARAADRLERLERAAEQVEPYITTKTGLATHPVLVEVRQQATVMARLIAALRLPDPRTGKRPQGRPLRGVHAPGAETGSVSSLERARRRAEGA
jgi:hypothetical protein